MTTHTATELTSPHDLLAAVPFMVGYHPKDSLVVMALVNSKVTMAMRVDFPESETMTSVSATIAGHLTRESAEEAIVVGYLPGDELGTDPLEITRSIISLQGISVKECIVVCNGRFRSNLCADLECCPPEGNLIPEILDSRVTAEQVAAGNPLPYLDLDEMKQSIAALPLDKELVREINAINEIDYAGEDVTTLQREGANAINEMAISFSKEQRVEDKALLAQVLVRLLDLQVRDYAMGVTTEETSDQLWDMWRYLLRLAPQGYVAPVAVIFATMSYERGDGALAQRALDRAMADSPGYQMAKLLRRTFAAGWPPSAFTQMRADLHPKICAAIFG
jgi:Domain of unknown function (DUF4192)